MLSKSHGIRAKPLHAGSSLGSSLQTSPLPLGDLPGRPWGQADRGVKLTRLRARTQPQTQ